MTLFSYTLPKDCPRCGCTEVQVNVTHHGGTYNAECAGCRLGRPGLFGVGQGYSEESAMKNLDNIYSHYVKTMEEFCGCSGT